MKGARDEQAKWDLVIAAAIKNAEEYPCQKCRYARYCKGGENCCRDYLRDHPRKPKKFKKPWLYMEKVYEDIRKRKEELKKCALEKAIK